MIHVIFKMSFKSYTGQEITGLYANEAFVLFFEQVQPKEVMI